MVKSPSDFRRSLNDALSCSERSGITAVTGRVDPYRSTVRMPLRVEYDVFRLSRRTTSRIRSGLPIIAISFSTGVLPLLMPKSWSMAVLADMELPSSLVRIITSASRL